MYDLIQSKAHKIRCSYCCCNIYFTKCVFLTQENYAFVHSADQKYLLHTNDFADRTLHFKQERRHWSPVFLNPLTPTPPSAPFYTPVAQREIIKDGGILSTFFPSYFFSAEQI